MINNVILCGRLTAAPELKKTADGTSGTAVTIAVERGYKTKDGERITDFINCIAWRGTAEFMSQYFKQGDPIAVVGEIQTRKYTDKNGNKRTAFEVKINDARFVPAKSSGNNTNTDNPPQFSNASNNDFTNIDDDLPF